MWHNKQVWHRQTVKNILHRIQNVRITKGEGHAGYRGRRVLESYWVKCTHFSLDESTLRWKCLTRVDNKFLDIS